MTTNQLIAEAIRNQARVCDLLQWTTDEYSIFMYNSGLQYLDKYIGKDEEAIDIIQAQAEFWNWWKLMFNARNEAFVHEWDGFEYGITVADMRTMYMDIHNPMILACEIKPPRQVYGNNFVYIQMTPA